MIEQEKTPQESAETLAKSLKENTSALRSVRIRYRMTFVSLLAVAALLLFNLNSSRNSDIARCEASNEVRQEIDEKFQPVADLLEREGVAETPSGRTFINLIAEDLPIRDCSSIGWFD